MYCSPCGVFKSVYPGYTRAEIQRMRDIKRCDCCYKQVERTHVKWNFDGLCTHDKVESNAQGIIACIYCDVVNLCNKCNTAVNRYRREGTLPVRDVVLREQLEDLLELQT